MSPAPSARKKVSYSTGVLACLNAAILSAGAAPVFEESFETGPLVPPWSVSTLGQGRVRIMEDFLPPAGAAALVLDDAVSDAAYSTSEAILSLDLTHQKNVILQFMARSLGNEPHAPPAQIFSNFREYDGVALSLDGGVTWKSVQSLAGTGTAWETYSVPLDPAAAALGGGYGSGVRIRFSGYDNAEVPLDGLAIDAVKLTAEPDQRTEVEIAGPYAEGSGPHTAYVLVSFAPAEDLVLTMSATPAGAMVLPETVTIPAGATSVQFSFSIAEDALFNPGRQVALSAAATGIAASSVNVGLVDNDIPTLSLTLPTSVTEGASPTANALLSLDRAPVVPLTVTLSADPSGQLTFPASVTVPAGQLQSTFTVQAVNDTKIDGDVEVVLTAASTGLTSASGKTTAIDNEARVLSLTLPVTVREGGSASGSVTLAGSLASPLTVQLTANPPDSLNLPATVVIPAGQLTASFTFSATDTALREGTRSVELAVTAAEYTGGTKSISIKDNDPAAFRFASLTDILPSGTPVPLEITALDVENNVLTGFTGSVNLRLVLPDQSLMNLTPASVSFPTSGVWSGTVTLPSAITSPLRIRAGTDANFYSDSPAFDLIRTMQIKAANLLYDSGKQALYAAVPADAAGAYANRVVAINPATLQVTGSLMLGQNPRQLALTSGGEFLYVSLDANGTIAKVNPATMTLVSTFAVGSDPSYGTLYAEDIQTIAGKPHQLLLSQYRRSVSPSHNGVALYDQGVRVSQKTQDHTGSNRIEPSEDPSIFFGYNTESTEFGFRRLKVDANGVSELEVNRNLFSGFYLDIKSAGNTVYAGTGTVVNGNLMQRKGTFGTTGFVCPDLMSHRVFFLESQSPWSNSSYSALAAYDPESFSLVRRLALPGGISGVTSFLRWGSNGLAFSSEDRIYLLSSSALVPSDPPADLSVAIQTTPALATAGLPLTYTVTLKNLGPNPSNKTLLNVVLSEDQTLVSVTSPTPATTADRRISVPVGTLESGQSTTLTLVTTPASAGTLSVTASAASDAVDADYRNNLSSKFISVGFVPAVDVINQIRIKANNAKYDPWRKLLWVTVPASETGPAGKVLYSLNPLTGLISDPVPLQGNPQRHSMALSANGRYLYIGLSDITEIQRIDLQSPSLQSLRIPLGDNAWGSAGYANDIHVLEGEGTSILVTTTGDESAIVFDGAVRREVRTGIYTVNRVEPTPSPNVFVGFNNAISSYPTSLLTLSPTGVAATGVVNSLIYGPEIRSAGKYVLSGSGQLLNVPDLSLKWNFSFTGNPAMDRSGLVAYLAGGTTLRAYDTTTGTLKATLPIPPLGNSSWETSLERWGSDGFAILGTEALQLVRWPAGCPPNPDSNENLIEDAWDAAHFGAAGIDPSRDSDGDGIADALEYVFGTSPHLVEKNPVQARVATISGGNRELHLVFPRRVGLAEGSYSYLQSADLKDWAPVPSVRETILSESESNGIKMETVEAVLSCPDRTQGFVRLRWNGP